MIGQQVKTRFGSRRTRLPVFGMMSREKLPFRSTTTSCLRDVSSETEMLVRFDVIVEMSRAERYFQTLQCEKCRTVAKRDLPQGGYPLGDPKLSFLTHFYFFEAT